MTHHVNESKYQPIENYGVIGNLHTVALVSRDASIDFMSFMRFDSPTIFCKLLDADKGGSFNIQPQLKDAVTKQLYLPNTNVLVTRFLAEEGIVEIIDYMPVDDEEFNCVVIRKVINVRGTISYKMLCAPRFNYARETHSVQKAEGACVFTPDTNTQKPLRLLGDVALETNGNDVTAMFTLQEGETTCFILEAVDNKEQRRSSLNDYVNLTYRQTIHFWQSWIKKCTYEGSWQQEIHRSALTLKLLISHKYGSMVAAPTFSLPEAVGEGRNWDYRYTWIRDAAFSMHAFLQLGFMEEAEAFLGWIKKQSTDKELQLMFTIDGDTHLDEYELHNLEGYKGSKPVHVGNGASKQTQMDIYGELMETLYVYVMHGGNLTFEYWKIICEYVELVMDKWHEPDHSIWEVRGEKREFLFSKMMCWVAMDRAIKIAEHFSFPYDILQWHKVRDKIFVDVYDNFWSEEKQAYVQYKGATVLDASALLMPILNIISPFDSRWQKTMEAIDKDLRTDVLIYRYREQGQEVDGLKGKEGTFTMCSFWHVECMALAGHTEKAREHFEKVLGYANHLGLYSEQLGLKGQHLGNFPQAFTHLALISAAIELSNSKKVHGITQAANYKNKMK
ncbi:MAG: glycoside hydrolase family 15 protein [Bacteroidota bacterium]|nr:glycoside hydrolase family 15 protein [Bacteroidota bacterium]